MSRSRKVAWLSPLPPARTGIAAYSKMILEELRNLVDLTAFVDQKTADDLGIEIRPARELDHTEFETIVYQLGNNLHHEFVYREASRQPGLLVLHDLVLHHLIAEMTLARGETAKFEEILRQNHGEAGAAFARARASGLHYETGNFLFPASIRICNDSRGVIVHNQWARDRLLSLGVSTPIHVVEHPVLQETPAGDTESTAVSNLPPDSKIIGLLGFVTAAKRPREVFRAFRLAHQKDERLHLVFAGEPGPGIDLDEMAAEESVDPDSWRVTGYLSDEAFTGWLRAFDRVISLRYPTAGESSGPLSRVFAEGKPVAVSDYAQFHELSSDTVERIPLGAGEIDALVEFMTKEPDRASIAAAQQAAITAGATPEMVARSYLSIFDGSEETRDPSLIRSSSALLPSLEVSSLKLGPTGALLELVNRSDETIPSIRYGSPSIQLDCEIEREGTVRFVPISLQGDLGPAETITTTIPAQAGDLVRLWAAHRTIHRYPGTPPLFEGMVG